METSFSDESRSKKVAAERLHLRDARQPGTARNAQTIAGANLT
jgi:hypothetical protein